MFRLLSLTKETVFFGVGKYFELRYWLATIFYQNDWTRCASENKEACIYSTPLILKEKHSNLNLSFSRYHTAGPSEARAPKRYCDCGARALKHASKALVVKFKEHCNGLLKVSIFT